MPPISWYPSHIRAYEIVVKCAGDAMLLRPDDATVLLLAEELAAAAKATSVELFAFGFVSTHGHIVVGAPPGARVERFQQRFKSRVAARINQLRERSGVVFQRKRPIPILSPEALVERIAYAHSQPVHHGLVDRAEQWPGLSSFRAVREGRSAVEVHDFDRQGWRAAGGEPATRARFETTVSIPLTRPPAWDGLTRSALGRALDAHESVIRGRERAMAAQRRREGRHLPKPESYRHVDPFSRSASTRPRRAAPLAHGSAEEVAAYRRAYDAVLVAYRAASARFRATGILCPFPEGTFPPRIDLPFETL